jgi:hypothetical protein
MSGSELDDVEHEGLSLLHVVPEAEISDVRDIAGSGLSVIGPMQMLALGPISVGLLGIAAATSEPWESTPMLGALPAGYSEPIAIPSEIAFGALSPSARRQLSSSRGVATVSRGLPTYSETTVELPAIELSTEVAAPVFPTVDIAPETNLVPAPPTSLSVQ